MSNQTSQTRKPSRTSSASRKLLATIVLGSTLLMGCGAASSGSYAPAGPANDEQAAAPAGGAATQAARAPAGTANPQQTAPVGGPAGGSVTENRLLARTASITLQVPDVAAAAARLRVIAAGKGGIISAENIVITESGTGKPSTLVVVVPSERLDAALEEIGAVGTIKLRAINTADVTAQVADIDARIRTQRESIARIQELIKRAGSVAEVAQVEGELTRRQAELESLLARQKALSNQVAESPITITLITPAMPTPTPEVEQPGFLVGLKAGWKAFAGFVAVSLMVVGGLLPFAVFFGLLGAAAWFVGKRVAAKRRANRPDPVWPTPPNSGPAPYGQRPGAPVPHGPAPQPRPADAAPTQPASPTSAEPVRRSDKPGNPAS